MNTWARLSFWAPSIALLFGGGKPLLFACANDVCRNEQLVRRKSTNNKAAFGFAVGRREALWKTASTLAGITSFETTASPVLGEEGNVMASAKPQSDFPFTVFSVTPDPTASLNPKLTSVQPSSFLRDLATGKNPVTHAGMQGSVLWLGEHHNSAIDHKLQAEFIRTIHEQRKMMSDSLAPPLSIGLEQVQVQFQSVLDDYTMGRISEEELCEQVDWDIRWSWPFEAYSPIFEVARELGISLVALNVNSEDLAEVEKAGLPGLPRSRLKAYITDPTGFAEFAKAEEFKAYVDYVISPSYDLHKSMGLLKYTISGQQLSEEMSFLNFFSGRILWDEAMASAAHSWTMENPGGLMMGLVGADHVKFSNGIPGRYARMAGGARESVSVMLNPTLVDTKPPGSVLGVADSESALFPDRLTLQLRYVKDGINASEKTGGILPLADYVVFSNTASTT